MRDVNLLVSLLKEVSENESGELILPEYDNQSAEDQKRKHHAELLADSAHATWKHPYDILRITNRGYDFLNALEKSSEAKTLFFDLIDKGMPYSDAAIQAILLVKRNLRGS
ncbi:MAG: hypothetical protein OXH31_00740 [Gammaproteobacteria bacterium]|nr:hypothetical protein [Gammaproteobacteria bacterium]